MRNSQEKRYACAQATMRATDVFYYRVRSACGKPRASP
jgi:hypothetical protein